MWRKSAVLIGCLLVAACAGDGPTRPGDGGHSPLAGGGRLASDDPFKGGPENSGPIIGDSSIGDILPDPGLIPLFYSHIDCANTPGQTVIRDSAAWRSWWEQTTACLWRDQNGEHGPKGPMDPMRPRDDSSWVDSIIIDSIRPCDRCLPEPPYVDFDQQVVLTIALETDSSSGCMRSLWVQAVEDGGASTIVQYEVSELGDDCCAMMMRPFVMEVTSPVVAVAVPRPVNEPIDWVRHDTTYNCHWEPDPNEPITLYYTDAPCDLGTGETVIRDSARFVAWMQGASTCDSIRWSQWDWGKDSTVIYDDSSWVIPGDSTKPDPTEPGPEPMPPIMWWFPHVDFSTHAVIILRAGDQTRWGGGIWLDAFRPDPSGTTIEYSVMEPGEDCPAIEPPETAINPTVAIRLPLPLADPISWLRRIESINCDWGRDTVWTEPVGPR